MKKYIISALLGLLLFPAISYAKCCDCCRLQWQPHAFSVGTSTIKKLKRLTINEMIDTETFRTIWAVTSKYNCVRCGRKLSCSTGDVNYYCTSCKIGFNIKEE